MTAEVPTLESWLLGSVSGEYIRSAEIFPDLSDDKRLIVVTLKVFTYTRGRETEARGAAPSVEEAYQRAYRVLIQHLA